MLSRVVVFNAGRLAEYELRAELLKKIHTLDQGFFGKMPPGEIMSRVANDLTQVRLLLGFGMLNLGNTILGLMSAAAATLSFSPKLTLAALAPVPLLFLVTVRFARLMYPRQRENQESLGKMSDFLQRSISGARVIKGFHLEPQKK